MREIYLPLVTVLRMITWRRRIVALLRILCGCLCALDAGYRWLTLQDTSYLLRIVHEPLAGFMPWLTVAQLHVHPFTICIAAAETVIACALICGALTNLACALAIFLTLLGCIGNAATGALTMFFGPGYFDPGIMLVFILAFLGLSLSNAGQLYGADHLLVSKLGGWSFLASSPRNALIPTQYLPTQHRASDIFSLPAVSTLTHTNTVESDNHSTHITHAPKERQRVLFM